MSRKRILYLDIFTIRISLLVLFGMTLLPIRAQMKRAMLVGISKYERTASESWSDIHGANDVSILTPVLKNDGFKVTTICGKNATASSIRNELKKIISKSKKGDLVYLHFSCHGQPFEDLNGDEQDGWDESIIPYDAQMIFKAGVYEGQNHITDDELSSYFMRLRQAVGETGYVCVVIDACHAGGASRGEEDDKEDAFVRGTKVAFSPQGKTYRPRINAAGHFSITRSAGLSHITILEACRSYQSNYEIKQDGRYYGPLSYYIYKTISELSIKPSLDWIRHVKKNMDADRRLTRQNMVYETSLK